MHTLKPLVLDHRGFGIVCHGGGLGALSTAPACNAEAAAPLHSLFSLFDPSISLSLIRETSHWEAAALFIPLQVEHMWSVLMKSCFYACDCVGLHAQGGSLLICCLLLSHSRSSPTPTPFICSPHVPAHRSGQKGLHLS